MSLNRYAKQRDANEGEIVAALEQVGATVWRLDRPMDLLVWFRGVFSLLEVKNPKRSYTIEDSQKAVLKAVGSTGPASIVRTVEEALKFIGAME